MSKRNHLSDDFVRSLRHFVFYYFNGTLNWVTEEKDILKDIDYRSILINEASLVEQAFAIYGNIIELDDQGKVLNDAYATTRAVKWIRFVCDNGYVVEPPFEGWEVELH
jgi:hypothetical protein